MPGFRFCFMLEASGPAPLTPVVSQILTAMRHIKLLGWLWLVLGGLWSLLALLAILSNLHTDLGSTKTQWMWWQDFIQDTVEVAIFVGSALAGLALLRRWRWSKLALWLLAPIWLAFSVLMVSSASGPLAMRLLWFGPSLAVSLYSLAVLSFVRYERKLG